MKLHGNARTCPNSRKLLVERIESRAWSLTAAAEAAGVSERTAYRWLARWRADGEAGLLDRSSAPRTIPHRTPAQRVEVIEKLRRLFMTAAEIAEVLEMALSTVSAVLRRIGLGEVLAARGASSRSDDRQDVRAHRCAAGARGPVLSRGSRWRRPRLARSSLRAAASRKFASRSTA